MDSNFKALLDYANESKDQELVSLVERVGEGISRRRRILVLIQEALGKIRLDMKYLMFDRDCLKEELQEARL